MESNKIFTYIITNMIKVEMDIFGSSFTRVYIHATFKLCTDCRANLQVKYFMHEYYSAHTMKII